MGQVSENTISTNHGPLYYKQYGNGSKVLLVFHGFGQDHTMAVPLAETYQNLYTIYSFDLPYHGRSTWLEDERVLTKAYLKEVFSNWFERENINTFSTLGYSMGGKLAISLAELFPTQADHLILVAPDGIFKSTWYSLAMSWPIKLLFRRVIDRPKLFFLLTKVVKATGLVSDKLLQFGESQMETRQLRSMVYYSWHNFKKMFMDKEIIGSTINKNNLQVVLILGQMDRVINPNKITPLIDTMGFDIRILEAGHAKVMEVTPASIRDVLLARSRHLPRL